MAMTLLTWSFEADQNLVGCGVDIEVVDRFILISLDGPHPMPFVFTKREIDHSRRGENAAELLCLSFSCKEALQKAAAEAYDYTDCELLPEWTDAAPVVEQEVCLSPRLKDALNIESALCRSFPNPGQSSEIISAVYLFGKERV